MSLNGGGMMEILDFSTPSSMYPHIAHFDQTITLRQSSELRYDAKIVSHELADRLIVLVNPWDLKPLDVPEEGVDQRVPLLPERHNMLSNEPDRVESHSKRRKIVVRSLLWIGEALRFDCVRHTRRGVESA